MYLRITKRKRKDGSEVRYLQLAHNDWDAAAKQSRVQVVYNFGREDELDRDAISRLISSLSRALPPGEALAVSADAGMSFVESRPMGAVYVPLAGGRLSGGMCDATPPSRPPDEQRRHHDGSRDHEHSATDVRSTHPGSQDASTCADEQPQEHQRRRRCQFRSPDVATTSWRPEHESAGQEEEHRNCHHSDIDRHRKIRRLNNVVLALFLRKIADQPPCHHR